MQRHKNSAFTLVELIVVITILAILGTIAFISLQGYSAISRDSVRISDVGTMTTALEVFQINAGKYPLPDQNGIFTYNGETLWTQGLFAGTVINNLSREIGKAPVDPLTDKEYTYSISGNKNNFQILNLLEGELVLNGTAKTNAAESVRTPRVTGSYNGIFVKTKSYLLPIPSIITSLDFDVDDETIIVSGTGITSQVISGGTNVPKIGNIKTGTGGIEGLSFEPIPITNIVSDGDKATVINAIKSAYSSSSLKDNGIYEYVLGVSGEENLAGLFDTIVLENFEDIVINAAAIGCESGTLTGSTYSSISYSYDALDSGLTGTGTGSPSSYTAIISCDNGIVSLGGESLDELYSFSSHTFTNCSATGRTGPTLSNCKSTYSATSWETNTDIFNQGTHQGYQLWTVPSSGMYTIDVYGASGKSGNYTAGYGAKIKGDFSLVKGEKLIIAIGQMGVGNGGAHGNENGGGGGSFVIKNSGNTPLIIAGGGGGSPASSYGTSCSRNRSGQGNASITTNGVTINCPSRTGNGGTSGNGGSNYSSSYSAAGGGLLSNGANAQISHCGYAGGGKSFANGLIGGLNGSCYSSVSDGGFGGGGAGGLGGPGAGGGYSGGGTVGDWSSYSTYGGGGGSYNQGTNKDSVSGNNSTHGKVIITKL